MSKCANQENFMASEASQILSAFSAGDRSGTDRLMEIVYDDMRGLADKFFTEETRGNTLQPTALVHEAFIKLVDRRDVDWRGKSHFFAAGATVMRRLLVDYARRRKATKRGGGRPRITLDEAVAVSTQRDEDVLAVDESLEKLKTIDKQQARIVELRFFGGLTNEEVAESLGVSRQTVQRHWAVARIWLRRELVGTG
jgi:RNA polymerase sigma-70 factor (ECF subfamily)